MLEHSHISFKNLQKSNPEQIPESLPKRVVFSVEKLRVDNQAICGEGKYHLHPDTATQFVELKHFENKIKHKAKKNDWTNEDYRSVVLCPTILQKISKTYYKI